ncbi:hypothetical protein ES705_38357 [subsurface metagenome]
MIGTNLSVFADLYGVGPLPKHWWPSYFGNPDIFTPLDELPADIRVLFEYDPVKARQMLADAGYPDGLTIRFTFPALPIFIDRAALLKDMWAKIGVELEPDMFELTVFLKHLGEGTFVHSTHMGLSSTDPIGFLWQGYTGLPGNTAEWSNERFDELADKIWVELDVAERNRLIKEAALIILREVPYIPTDIAPAGHFWWPWVKNYYGERNVGGTEVAPVLGHIWIDRELKTEMGY